MIGSIQCAYERGRRDSVRQLESSGCPVEDIAHYAGMTIDKVNKLEWRISKLNPDAHPENQVHLTIRIKRNMNDRKEA